MVKQVVIYIDKSRLKSVVMSTKRLGKFGEFVKQYEKARRSYPPEVLRFLKSLIKVKNPKILDIGCGTGISTRQLKNIGEVTGVDPDPKMLKAARAHKSKVKIYVLAKAEKLPFKSQTFDIVTAFSALHWFDDKKSLLEIKRVLKPGGLFFVGGHTGSISWGKYRNAIIEAIGQEIAQFKSVKFNPKKLLIGSGFKKVKVRLWNKKEYYTLKNAIEYVQSVSIWQSVPRSLRQKALKGVEEYFKNILRNYGKIERKLIVKVVAGIK